MREIVEPSIYGCKHLWVDAPICRHEVTWRVLLFVRRDDAVRDSEPLCIAPVEFPDLLDGTPDGAETPGALAQALLDLELRHAQLRSHVRKIDVSLARLADEMANMRGQGFRPSRAA